MFLARSAVFFVFFKPRIRMASLSLVAGIYSPVEKNRGGVNSTTKSDFSDGCGTYERIALRD